MRRVWVLPWCLVVHLERFAALWVRVVSRRLVCDVHTHCSGISLTFGSKISHLDVKLDIRVGELISVVKQP